VIHGAASIIFGALTLLWPDVSLLIIGLAFAVKLISFGLSRILTEIRHDATAKRRLLSPTTSALVTLVLALVLAGISFILRTGGPVVDEFYTPPAAVPDRPGALIRSEPFTRAVP